jgi:hypothetical protein
MRSMWEWDAFTVNREAKPSLPIGKLYRLLSTKLTYEEQDPTWPHGTKMICGGRKNIPRESLLRHRISVRRKSK